MKRILTEFVLVVVFSLSIGLPAFAANRPPQKGEMLPVMNLPIPKSPGERSYLGLTGVGSFKISQIKANVVIIEIFSMYCPYCQKDAPGVNELYDLVENNPDLKNKVKIIGIGAGNSTFEVGVYKKTYRVPFPLIPDQDFTIHKACGEVRTPYFIVVQTHEDGSPLIVHSQLGDYPGAKPFLELVLKSSGLK
jgi:thiol-disulfide isomerase/thioredoxin